MTLDICKVCSGILITQIGNACCFSQVSWNEAATAASSYEQSLLYILSLMK